MAAVRRPQDPNDDSGVSRRWIPPEWYSSCNRSGCDVSFWLGNETASAARIEASSLASACSLNRRQGFFVDGSFVTNKMEPNDVDAVVWIPGDFHEQVNRGEADALELESMLVTRRPEELFAAEDRRDWDDWVEFFGRTREIDRRRKGIVEIEL